MYPNGSDIYPDTYAYPDTYKGRFAPSATGDLHLGSLVTALACALDARINNGPWIIRIDDIDHNRCTPQSSRSISEVLHYYFNDIPFQSIYHQSETLALYQHEFNRLASEKLVYRCYCSRKDLAQLLADQKSHHCRNNTVSRFSADINDSFRFKSQKTALNEQLLEDAILFRRDGCFSYHFSCVVNDEFDGITHVIRGADLMDAEQPQSQLIEALGYRTLKYYYVPLVENQQGQKLSKQNKAAPITLDHQAPAIMRQALLHLKWHEDALKALPHEYSIEKLMQWASKYWQPAINF